VKVLRIPRLPWRHVGALLPAVALVGTGAALAMTGGPVGADAVADGGHQISVPGDPVDQGPGFTLPPLPQVPGADPTGQPGTQLPPETLANGIPAQALAAYQRAAQLLGAADPECRVDWPLIAALGKVESDHGRYAGSGLDLNGTVRPGIYGLPLDGSDGTALVRDTDRGSLDRDPTYDRAVGPMQFIPGTWRRVGVDANGDGAKDPQNIGDAATAAAVYLCSGPGDLTDDSTLTAAILRYNNSMDYAEQVKSIAEGYRRGYSVIPATPLPSSSYSAAPYLPTRAGAGRSDASAPEDHAAGGGSSERRAPQPTSTGSGSGSTGTGSSAGSDSPAAAQSSGSLDPVTKVVSSVVSRPSSSTTTSSPSPTETCYVNLLGVRVCDPL
jgi:hypothetical protein